MFAYTLIGVGYIVLGLISGLLADAFHIDIKPRSSLDYNGRMITEKNLHKFLEHHEKMILFGHQKNGKNKKTFKLVDVQHKKRHARSTEPIVSLRISNDDADSNINLEFQKATHLIDGGFVFIRRYENSSVLIKDFDKLAEKYSDCFYRNENSALDVCDGNIRGVIHQNSTQYVIHPLPDRFGSSSHIILELPTSSSSVSSASSAQLPLTISSTADMTDSDTFDGISFEPNMTDFEPSTSDSLTEFEPTTRKNYTDNLSLNNKSESITNRHDTNNSSRQRNTWIRIPHSSDYSADRRQQQQQQQRQRQRQARLKRHIDSKINATTIKIPQILNIETAIFVDKDLYRHMAKNFPKNTEASLIRFVLAMINGVQLLYHHPSLGRKINFVLKRLEILHTDPKELRRSSDIDIFLNSFCSWQRKFNPASDDDIVHFDHAVILTGLDLYVVAKNGKVSSQVVGLAPVAGMCTTTSSCTINEGKHFESVFVVAHEIGHNLGMRHDTSENNCDPSLYIMSPTLGSGKITWSKCSQNYLKSFLDTSQAKCMFDRGQQDPSLDHAAEGRLPGERFDADQQCMLKYGKDSVRSKIQPLKDICRDLHCQRDRYTWTSHPALEGTSCGDFKWCRSGSCILRSKITDAAISVIPRHGPSNRTPEKSNLIDGRKSSNYLKQDYTFNRVSMWSEWAMPGDCDSSCLFGTSGRLREGSTGLRTFRRTCLDYRYSRKKCTGPDRKYEACSSKQCYKVSRTTVTEFANQICNRAKAFDADILMDGLQAISANPSDSCKVFCKSKSGKPITKSWIYPDGTTCRNTNSDFDDNYYCINGRCEKFTCENSTSNYFKSDSAFCPQNLLMDQAASSTSANEIILDDPKRGFKKYHEFVNPSSASLVQNVNENESTSREPAKMERLASNAKMSEPSPRRVDDKSNNYKMDSFKVNNYQNDGHQIDEYQSDRLIKPTANYRADNYKLDDYKADVYQLDNYKTTKAEIYQPDNYEPMNNYNRDDYKRDSYKTDQYKSHGYHARPEYHASDRPSEYNHSEIYHTESRPFDGPYLKDHTPLEDQPPDDNLSDNFKADQYLSEKYKPTTAGYRSDYYGESSIGPYSTINRKSKSKVWNVKSGCHISCMEESKGIQIVKSSVDDATNIQLCEADTFACDKVLSPYEFATQLCSRYQLKVRGLSGEGMQIAPSSVDLDRSCKVACQDEYLRHRFYLVNGENGYFPFGTRCSRTNDNRYCVNGKCLEFGADNVPLVESYISLALYRSKRSTELDVKRNETRMRLRRSFIYFDPVNITETISPQLLQSIIDSLEYSRFEQRGDGPIDYTQLDLLNPIHISYDEY